MMTSLVISQQKRKNDSYVMSSCVPDVVYETALKAAELGGYESMSHFIMDAVIEKTRSTTLAAANVVGRYATTHKQESLTNF